MDTKIPSLLILKNEKSTQQLAEVIAGLIRDKSVRSVVLSGDLGAGKTTFTQFLVRALGSSDYVSSPTFMLEKVYQTDVYKIVHMDLYRVGHDAEIAMTMSDYFEDPETVVVAEWADDYKAMQTVTGVRIVFKTSASNEFSREIQLFVPEVFSEYVSEKTAPFILH
jgi:tRNA threonylcarbamoyladenosine biosynthesis protein TsaE